MSQLFENFTDEDVLVAYILCFVVLGPLLVAGIMLMIHYILFRLVRRYRARWARFYATRTVGHQVLKDFDRVYKSSVDAEEKRIMEQPSWTFMFPCMNAAHVILPAIDGKKMN